MFIPDSFLRNTFTYAAFLAGATLSAILLFLLNPTLLETSTNQFLALATLLATAITLAVLSRQASTMEDQRKILSQQSTLLDRQQKFLERQAKPNWQYTQISVADNMLVVELKNTGGAAMGVYVDIPQAREPGALGAWRTQSAGNMEPGESAIVRFGISPDPNGIDSLEQLVNSNRLLNSTDFVIDFSDLQSRLFRQRFRRRPGRGPHGNGPINLIFDGEVQLNPGQYSPTENKHPWPLDMVTGEEPRQKN